MIVFISAKNPELSSEVESRFGRSPNYVKVDTETMQWEGFANPAVSQSGGAGVAASQFVVNQGAQAVISGDFGPNAAGVLRAAKIDMHLLTEDAVTVQQAVDLYMQGKLPVFS